MATRDDRIEPATGRLALFVRHNTLPTFFILAFALTWPLEVVDALGSHGVLPLRVPILLQLLGVAYMPSVAALVVAGITGGGDGVRSLFRKLLIWRVGLRWYAVAILGFAFICGGAILLANGLGGSPPVPLLGPDMARSPGWQLLIMLPVLYLVVTLVNGEELAWRGFALPRLQARWDALTSSILLGLVWAAFHLPLFLTRTGPSLDFPSMVSRSAQIVGASVIFTWLYNHTRGSVLLAYLLHGGVNTWTRVFPIGEAPPLVGWLTTGLTCLIAALLVALFGAEHLRRSGPRIREADAIVGGS